MDKHSGGDRGIVVYVDLLFLENVLINSALLLLTCLFLKQPASFLRIMAAAAAGSLYCCIDTVWTVSANVRFPGGAAGVPGIIQNIASTGISYILLSMLMIFLAFGIHNKHILMKNVAVLYGTAIFTGGVFSLLENLVTPNRDLIPSAPAPESYEILSEAAAASGMLCGWLWLGLCTGAACAAGIGALALWNRRQSNLAHIYELCLEFGVKKVTLRVLLDTGNQLHEPVFGRPVTVVEQAAVDEILQDTCFKDMNKARLSVPFHTIGIRQGKMTAVVADRAVICDGRTLYEYAGAVIGIYPGHFSGKGTYQGILHPQMLTGARLCARERRLCRRRGQRPDAGQ